MLIRRKPPGFLPVPPRWRITFPSLLTSRIFCEGGVDVESVVTPLGRGGAQVSHGDQVVELSVLFEVHEKEEEGEDGEGQIEVESERGELKERRSSLAARMIWDSRTLEPWGACDPTSKCDEDYALSVHAQVLCILRVFMFVSLYLLLMWFVSCSKLRWLLPNFAAVTFAPNSLWDSFHE